MYGIYLQCERCHKTIGGEDVTAKQQGIPTLHRFEGNRLRELAALRGWTHRAPNDDYCPECSATVALSPGAIIGYGLRKPSGQWGSWLYPYREWAERAAKDGGAKFGYKVVPLTIAPEERKPK